MAGTIEINVTIHRNTGRDNRHAAEIIVGTPVVTAVPELLDDLFIPKEMLKRVVVGGADVTEEFYVEVRLLTSAGGSVQLLTVVTENTKDIDIWLK